MISQEEVKELAQDYIKLQNIDEENVDLIDHIQLYESLVNRIEKAGFTLYDFNRHVHFGVPLETAV